MKNCTSFFSLAFLTLLLTACRPDTAFINSAEVIDRHPMAQRIRAVINKQTAPLQKKLQKLRNETNDLQKSLKTMEKTLTPGQKAGSLKTLQQNNDKMRQLYGQIQAIKNQMDAEYMTPVYKEINTIITHFGKSRGYDLILGTTRDGNIVYADDDVNVTKELIAYMLKKLEKPIDEKDKEEEQTSGVKAEQANPDKNAGSAENATNTMPETGNEDG